MKKKKETAITAPQTWPPAASAPLVGGKQTAKDVLVGTAHVDTTMEEIGKQLAKVEASLQQVTQNKANIDKAFENLPTFSTKLETLTSQVAAMQNQLETSISAMDGNSKANWWPSRTT